MTGVGGRTLEQLATDGWLSGILDVTTTELADELVGGLLSYIKADAAAPARPSA